MMMHDVDLFGIGESEYHKTVRPEGEIRIAEADAPARRERRPSTT